MRRINLQRSFFYLFILFFLLNLPNALIAQLHGTYTIGSGGYYASITDAVNELNNQGISDAVVFQILDSTFIEQVELTEIEGSSASHTIIFESASGDSTAAIIYYEASGSNDNFVVKVNGTDYVTFRNITVWAGGASYNDVFVLEGTISNLTIENCLINGIPGMTGNTRGSIFSNSVVLDSLTVQNSIFNDGSYGIFLDLSADGTNTRIYRNQFDDQYGAVYLNNQQAPWIAENTITGARGRGIELIHCDGGVKIINNRLEVLTARAIALSTCYGGAPPIGTAGLIANNMITVGSEDNAAEGIRLETSTYQNIYFNSIWNRSTSYLYARSLYVTGGNNIKIQNNNFANENYGYACYINSPAAIVTFDYNNLYSPANYLGFWGADCDDLDSLQTISGMNQHSLSVFPHYTSDTDLHSRAPWLDEAASAISGIPEIAADIDGETRDELNPDIGADAFTPDPGTTTPLSGTYLIGYDYSSFTEAIDDLVLRGINGPVTINVVNGNYYEQIELVSIPGATSEDTVTFRSQNHNAGYVSLLHSAAGQDDNYVIHIKGADHIRLRDMTFQANNSPSATYGRVIIFSGGAYDVVIRDNQINGAMVTNSGSNELALCYGLSSRCNKSILDGNMFHYGTTGIYFEIPTPIEASQGLQLINNTIYDCFAGMYLRKQDSFSIINNNIFNTDSRGIELEYCSNAINISKNRFDVESGYGLSLNSCNGGIPPFGKHGTITNNFIRVAGDASSEGLRFINCSYLDVFYNNINISGTHPTTGRGISLNTVSNIRLLNNIFCNSGGGYALYLVSSFTASESDYNDLYTSGSNLAYWTTNQTDLAALQTENGMEVHSISIDPGFFSQSDLHVTTPDLNGAAQWLDEVTVDIDGESRDPANPDIGADQFEVSDTNYFTELPYSLTDMYFSNAVWGDYDRDNDLDVLILGSSEESPNTTKLFQNGVNGFSEVAIPFPGVAFGSADWGDIDNDNDLDLAISGETSTGEYITKIFRNDGQNYFTELAVNIVGVYRSSVAWGDCDNDGDQDLLVCGATGTQPLYAPVSRVYRNNGDGSFTDLNLGLTGIHNGSARWIDYNHDGYMDIFITGAGITKLYKNYGRLVFMDSGISLPGYTDCDADWTDYDQDGDTDLIICGQSGGNERTRIYRNEAGLAFTEINAGFQDVAFGSVRWGDFDNDGDSDLLLAGADPIITTVYLNENNGAQFEEAEVTLEPVLYGSAVWGDYDHDSDLDVLLTGMNGMSQRITKLYRNNISAVNTPPVTPANLHFFTSPTSAELIWDSSDDAETDAQALTYNLRVGTSPGSGNILSPMTAGNNSRLIVEGGNVLQRTNHSIYSLTPGLTYYWSVQTIDNGFLSSDFAEEQSFSTPNASFTDSGIELPGVYLSSVDWGDYDQDGDLDLALSGGTEYGKDSLGISRIYRNDDGVFTDIGAGLPAMRKSTIKWVESADNDPDILLWGWDCDERRRIGYLYSNRGDGTFHTSDFYTEMFAADDASISIADMDNNGSQDALILGARYYLGGPPTIRYDIMYWRYLWHFEEIIYPRLWFGSALFIDYDGDSDMDYLVAGRNEDNQTVAEIYRNNGPDDFGEFSYYLSLPGTYAGDAGWGDFDQDGDPDIILTGFTGIDSSRGTILYRNDGGNFTEIESGIIGLNGGALDWGDCDNDGDLDLLITGFDGANYQAKIYRNDGSDGIDRWKFTDIMANIAPAAGGNSSAGWTDYDRDGNLDIIISGYNGTDLITKIYHNTNGNPDLPPDTPQGLTVTYINSNSVRLSWNGSTDDNTDTPALTYNLRIGKSPGGTDVFSPMARTNGQKLTLDYGNVYQNTSWIINELNMDKDYYWSVQTVDAGYKNSAFAAEQTFNIPGSQYANHEIPTDIAAGDYDDVQWADFTGDGSLDLIVIGESEDQIITNLYRNEGALAEGWHFTELTQTIAGIHTGSISWCDFNRDNALDLLISGQTDEGTAITKLYRNDGPDGAAGWHFNEVTTSLINVSNSVSAWADFDNDGDQDLIICGQSNQEYHTKIYRNAGPLPQQAWDFKEKTTELPGLSDASVAWGDLDNDGDQDLIMTGFYQDEYRTLVYRNEGITINGQLILHPMVHNLPVFSYPALQVGDVNADGRIDVMLSGVDNYNNLLIDVMINLDPGPASNEWHFDFARVIEVANDVQHNPYIQTAFADMNNDGLLDIVCMSTKETGIYLGHIGYYDHYFLKWENFDVSDLTGIGRFSIGDFDRDNDLDLILNKSSIHLIENKIDSSNTAPAMPAGLSATIQGTSVILSWNPADDDQTSTEGLSYNIRMGTSYLGTDVISPMSFYNGVQRIPKPGNSGYRTRYRISNLNPETKYYWTVQTVDNTFMGSFAASVDSFITGSVKPQILSVTDVPLDFGKRVTITWQACAFDTSLNSITHYSIWRAIPGSLNKTAVSSIDAKPVEMSGKPNLKINRTQDNHPDNVWEWMGDMEAHKLNYYSFTCPTLYDQTEKINGKHYFLISAHTTNPTIFYDSEVDSGYSIQDFNILNLAKKQSGSSKRIDAAGEKNKIAQAAQILSVKDVINDQGGQVHITWNGSPLDSGFQTITSYSIWRTIITQPGYSWERIVTQPAHQFKRYSITVPTLYDSVAGNSAAHYYMISAHTADANVFYDSAPMAGRSVDNTAPVAPAGLVGTLEEKSISLHWEYNRENDIARYVIYRDTKPGIDPNATPVYETVMDTSYIDVNPQQGDAYYIVCAQDIHGNISLPSNELRFSLTGILRNGADIPTVYALYQNFPNPFNPYTTIAFDLPKASKVRLEIFNILGRKVGTLVNESLPAGRYKYYWDPNGLASGLYIYRIKAEKFVKQKKMILVK